MKTNKQTTKTKTNKQKTNKKDIHAFFYFVYINKIKYINKI